MPEPSRILWRHSRDALYVEAFRAVGQDVDIELVPVSPKLVGQLIETSTGADGAGSVEVSTDLVSSGPEPVDCALEPGSCTMVIRISVETTGKVRYKVGRAARPGETLQDPVRVAPETPTPGRSGVSSGGSSSGGGN
ncbi:hypothetical protein GCM10022225_83400 [Plantactinospora mayteni]|uniref:Uncharacterized protein n=1 Tax=Plantactinospora mayteni TaxID=566021 RepID=A0ABQ4F4E6_9ACTN|nr:hypothetical protein [Plantactinospora mayteni]GIH01763.1 hypothetical protein Pma05_83350 [Plantactinospora mayteni]